MSNLPRISIVILNWNNAPDTLDCLRSVFALDYGNFNTIVVDNGSRDDSVMQIRRAFPQCELLETNENLGYAEGNNVGIRHALAAGADYIFILNNDTLVAPNTLTELVQIAEMNPRLGMVGPHMFCLGNDDDLLFATGSYINWAKGKTWNRDMFLPRHLAESRTTPEPADFITGCGVLVRRELVETIGLMDPSYFLNFEDVEWAQRAWRHGFEVWYVPQALLWHKVSATLGQSSPANTYYFTRNALGFFWHNAPVQFRLLALARILVATLRTVGAWSLLPRYRSDSFRRRRSANLYALRDFFLGRFGPMGPDVARSCYPQ